MHLVARRRLHRPRSLLGLEPRLDQPGARLPAVPAPLLRAGRRARGVRRRQGRRGRLRRPHRRHSARQPAGADAGRRQDAAVERRRRVDAGHALPRAPGRARPRSSRSARRATSPAQASDRLGRDRARSSTSTSINGFPLDEAFVDGLPGKYDRLHDDRGRPDRHRRRRPARLRRLRRGPLRRLRRHGSITSASSIRRSRRRTTTCRSGSTTA